MKLQSRSLTVLIAALPLVLAACGNKEPEQRAAFTQFLQTRIVDKPGVHVPQLSAAEKASFGDYAAQYAVITDFNAGMNNSVKPLGNIVQKGAMRSLGDIVAHRDEVKAARDMLSGMRGALDAEQAKADAAHAQLKQADDLKAVYDKAYDKTVTLPANTFKEIFPQVDAAFASGLKIVDFVEENKARIEISGLVVKVQSPAVQADLNKLLQEMNEHARGVNQAQSRLRSVMLGN
ncbi:DUF3053 family protein [Cupriavidus basilensis]|uniref:DUF3053 family protein n=1 Tax=Cupriavidus basilensis TaxID=68895 RepID=A0ABT6AGR0_9BURK|nr:DUF3053 family protein [Cupriavidus basilensis]MDF3831780.1 DUF3053 family protein [Cupriavidus basilensis]